MRRLKDLRVSRGVNAADIAYALGITAETYFGYESGQTPPDLRVLSGIADFFGVSVDFLLERSDDPSYSESIYYKPNIKIPDVLQKAGLDVYGEKDISQQDIDEMAQYAESLKNRKKK